MSIYSPDPRSAEATSASRSRRKQAKPRSVKQTHQLTSLSSSEDENELLREGGEGGGGGGCGGGGGGGGGGAPASAGGRTRGRESRQRGEDRTDRETDDSPAAFDHDQDSLPLDSDDLEEEEEADEEEDDDEEEEEEDVQETRSKRKLTYSGSRSLPVEGSEGMTTPNSPTETTASTETSASTGSSSLEEMQMSYTIGVTEGTPYPCQFCDKAFPRLSYLKRHEQIHSDQMPFRCEYCQRLFKHKRSRDRHIKLHTGDKRYRCAHCESAFSRSDHLKIHMKTHDHMKPFQCAICNRGYNTAAALTSHMQNHKRSNTSTSHGLSAAITSINTTTMHSNNSSLKSSSILNLRNADSPLNKSINSSIVNKLLLEKSREKKETANNSDEDTPKGENGTENETEAENEKETRSSPKTTPKVKAEEGSSNSSSNCIDKVGILSNCSGESALNSGQEQQQVTCGFCGVRCASLDVHIREAHLHHLLFAGLLQSTFYPTTMPNWPPLMPPPPLPATLNPVSASNDINSASLHPVLANGRISPPTSPKRPKLSSSSPLNGLLPVRGSSSSSSSPLQNHHHLGLPALPLLCNQCSPSPTFPDFESFRIHLKSHLMVSQPIPPPPAHPLPHPHSHSAPSLSHPHAHAPALALSHHQCPYCGDVITSDFETHIVNSHLGTVTTQYGCESCSKLFAKPDELQKHLMDIHAHHLYQCSLCRDMFDSKVSVQVHFAVKHSNECKLYKCNICGELWNNERDFKVHIKLVHLQPQVPHPLPPQPTPVVPTFPGNPFHLFGSKAYFKCKFCGEEFHIEFLLERHLESHHANQLQQERKARGNQERLELLSPVTLSNSSSGSKAAKNGSKVGSTSSLKSDTFPGEQSSKTSSSELELHLKSHPAPKSNSGHHPTSPGVSGSKSSTTKCNICDELCCSLSDLAEHKLRKHCVFGASGTSQCVECHGNISTQAEYMKHFAQHYNASCNSNNSRHSEDTSSRSGFTCTRFPVSCIICKQTLTREMEVDLHARFHCPPPIGAPSKAHHERKSAAASSSNVERSPTTLAATIKSESKDLSHVKSKPPSPVCNEATTASTLLKPETPPSTPTPTTTGMNGKRYQCIKCQESFGSEWDIQEHVRQHLAIEGSMACNLCDNEFDSPAKLQCHLIEHNFNGGDEYKCHFCTRIWGCSQSLQNHMNEEHLNDRPYSCGQCQQRFWFPTELDNHNIGEHKEVDMRDEEEEEAERVTRDEERAMKRKDREREREKDRDECREGKDRSRNQIKLDQKHGLSGERNGGLESKTRYSCGVCGKKFGRREQRKHHMRSAHSSPL